MYGSELAGKEGLALLSLAEGGWQATHEGEGEGEGYWIKIWQPQPTRVTKKSGLRLGIIVRFAALDGIMKAINQICQN